MTNTKNFCANAAAIIYFIGVMLGTILLLLLVPVLLLNDIATIRESGFSSANDGWAFIALLALFIGISMLIPAFRRIYYNLPWLFPLVRIFYINVVITAIANVIMNFGYEIQDEKRHAIYFTLTIAAIVVGRILMCLWFNKRRVEHIEGQINA
jgi:CDP-diglyceride synthetase